MSGQFPYSFPAEFGEVGEYDLASPLTATLNLLSHLNSFVITITNGLNEGSKPMDFQSASKVPTQRQGNIAAAFTF